MIYEIKKKPAHILVVDDDNKLRNLLQKYLRENGFEVTTACDSDDADSALSVFCFDILIVDVMMPKEDGLSFTKRLRQKSDVPILMLTAMGDANDRISGFEHGADDYLAKPFEPRELVLRINSILKRIPLERKETASNICLGNCIFNPNTNDFIVNGEKVNLTPTESLLLKVLSERAGQIVSREELADLTGSGQNLRTIDVQVTRLRKRIEPDTRIPRHLQTIRGKGYLLLPD